MVSYSLMICTPPVIQISAKVLQETKGHSYDKISARYRSRLKTLLSRGGPQRRPNHRSATWFPQFFAYVPRLDSATGGKIPCNRAGLCRFRLQRCAGCKEVRLHLRQPGGSHRGV